MQDTTAFAALPLAYDITSGVIPDSKVHGANMGRTWVLLAPDGPHVDPMNFAIRDMALPTQEFLSMWTLITIYSLKLDLYISMTGIQLWWNSYPAGIGVAFPWYNSL